MNAAPTSERQRSMTPTRMLLAAAMLPLALAACSHADDPRAANEANFRRAMTDYLARRGDLCLARSSWPVDITREELAQGSRNSVQLPVLERLGLVASSQVEIDLPAEDARPARRTKGTRYQLTDSGRRYYLARAPHQRDTGTRPPDRDFCVAHLTLRKVVGWEPPGSAAEGAETVVSFTYDIAAAPWTSDADARRVFPVVDRIVQGAGRLQLKEAMVLTAQGWQAKDL